MQYYAGEYMKKGYYSNYNNGYNNMYNTGFTNRYGNNSIRYRSQVMPKNYDVSQKTGNTCSDGQDDGKIGFKEGVEYFCKGLVKPIEQAVKHPFKTALAVAAGVGLAVVTGGAAVPFMIAGGLAAGTVQVGKGLIGCATATTDAQKKDALENMGTGTFTVAGSLVGAKGYAKGVTGSSQTLKGSLGIVKDSMVNATKQAGSWFAGLFKKPVTAGPTVTPQANPTAAPQANPTATSNAPQLEAPKSNVPQLEAPKNNTPLLDAPDAPPPSGGSGNAADVPAISAPNSSASSGTQVKWDVDSINAAMKEAASNGNAKQVYHQIAKEIHTDGPGGGYSNVSTLMPVLKAAKKLYC